MKWRDVVISGVLAALAAGLLSGLSGCFGSLGKHLSKERTGNVTVMFLNDTAYRAAFSFGSYDAWDRTPGSVDFEQLAVAPYMTSNERTLVCRRNVAIATQGLVDRVVATDADQEYANFNPDQFGSVVNFSSAPQDSDPVKLPTVGTAAGREVLLGLDFSCEDMLLFTFVRDSDAEGGFRIDFEAIQDKPPKD